MLTSGYFFLSGSVLSSQPFQKYPVAGRIGGAKTAKKRSFVWLGKTCSTISEWKLGFCEVSFVRWFRTPDEIARMVTSVFNIYYILALIYNGLVNHKNNLTKIPWNEFLELAMKTDNIPLTYLTLNLIFFMFFLSGVTSKTDQNFLLLIISPGFTYSKILLITILMVIVQHSEILSKPVSLEHPRSH